MYPLNKSKMVYCNVEVKIPYLKILPLAIIIHHNVAHKLLFKQTKFFRNFNPVLLPREKHPEAFRSGGGGEERVSSASVQGVVTYFLQICSQKSF